MEFTLNPLSSGWTQAVLLGGWFGLLHAFDADHIATIGGLAVGNRSLTPMGYALRWALGHAAALGVIGAAVLGLGATGLVEWTSYAEFLVCLALLLIGGNALRTLVSAHGGRGAPRPRAQPHLHFLTASHTHAPRSGRAGVWLGVLHGSAGSAAVLALLPLAQFRNGLESAVYLVFFSVGVAAGALGFAHVLAKFFASAAASGQRLSAALRGVIGVLAIASGAWLFIEITYGGG